MKVTVSPWVLALLLMVCPPVFAQPAWIGPLTPAEPTTADRVSLTLTIGAGYNYCDLMMPGEVSVSREGDAILVDYFLRLRTENDPPLPPETLCLAAPGPPFPVTADLGYLPAGDFHISVSTSIVDRSGFEESVVSFAVHAAPPTFIPSNASWALSLMLLGFGRLAAWRLRGMA